MKIIGISGGSGAGKTTLANALLQHYEGEALVISYDRYYKTMPCGNYDIPEALDTELLLEHLRLLKSGQVVNLPIYDRKAFGGLLVGSSVRFNFNNSSPNCPAASAL